MISGVAGNGKSEQKRRNRSEHAIVTDREIDKSEYSKTGDDWMAQYPSERGLEEVKQHIVDKAAHEQSSRNLTDIYTKPPPLRKDRFWPLP